MHGKVLDITASKGEKGTKVICFKQGNRQPNQMWTLEDCGNGYICIVSMLNPVLCLDVKGGENKPGAEVVVWERRMPPGQNQMWQLRGPLLTSALNPDLVLDIEASNKNDGAKICVWKTTNNVNQQWEFEAA